VKFHR